MNFSLFKQNFFEFSNRLIGAFLKNYVTHRVAESEVFGRSRIRTVKRSRCRSRNILFDSDCLCPISLHVSDVNRATYAAAQQWSAVQ